MDIVKQLREAHWADARAYAAADEIERLREEVKELEDIMDEKKCAVGYLIAKRALKKHGMWKLTGSE